MRLPVTSKASGTLLLIVAALLGVSARSFGDESEETRTESYDWGKITAPLAVTAGRNARIEVSLHGAAPSGTLNCHLTYLDEGGTPTGYVLYPPSQDLTAPDGVYVFSVSCPQVGDAAEVVPLVFISSDGTWEGRTKDGEGPRIRLEKWCSVSAPHEARRGGWLNIEVSLGLVPAPNLLVVHLLLLDEDGKQVSALYAPPAVVSESGGEHAFRFELPGTVEASKVRPLVFLSPSGRWEDKQLNFDAADIGIEQ